MANNEHLIILKQGVKLWNQWRTENREVRPNLMSAYLSGCSLRGINLSYADLGEADLSGTDLYNAVLNDASLYYANLISSNLKRADIINGSLIRAKLNHADLGQANLSHANLSEADLEEADLSGADLGSVILTGSDLTSTNLMDASLKGADLRNANLTRASLNRANLVGADFSRALLKGSILNEAIVGWTTFGDIDLSAIEGLSTVAHYGPSSIGIDAIYRSNGNISEIFLRRAGVPDNLITYIGSLTGKAFDFYSCFISYSSNDQDFAERLYSDLQNKCVRCWFAPDDLKIGDKFRQKIDESIRLHDKLLPILSEKSITSPWVEDEVEAALEREHKENRLVLFPISIDDAVWNTDQAWAASLRRMRHIGSFKNWKLYDSYQKAFERLLRDLGTGSS